ncbi:DUF1330 domain-containing protein [Ktedonobacteria bacterium brp13]|nr:DUF1330 domain-containing protein [Ktedonobacteria bacterium brp13]
MAVFFVVDIKEITDPETYAEYRKGVAATLEPYHGEFLVRGGSLEVLEGEWETQRFVIITFPDEEHFKGWYYSPEYTALRQMRISASTGRAILAQGVQAS